MSQPARRLLFGLKLRQLRQERGLSFAELAARTGLSVSYLNEIEKGKKLPRPDKLRDLARGLECNPAWLAGDDPGPHLAPVAALLQSNFLNELPLDLFGIDSIRVLELLSTAPLRVSAFVSSLVELAQNHALGADHFYLSAMRAYQELHNNYFPALEEAARACRNTYGIAGAAPETSLLKRILINDYGVRLVRDGLSGYPALQHLRAVYVESRKELLLHPGLNEDQLRFHLAKEIGFQFLPLQPRPSAASTGPARSFNLVLHNFQAGYFAVALLMEEKEFLRRLGESLGAGHFHPSMMLDWLREYRVGPEVLFQRFNVITAHWGLDNVFFHRLIYREREDRFLLDKELHLHRIERRYAGRPDEQYCRRWLSTRLIRQLTMNPGAEPVTGMSKARYEPEGARWLCLGIARSSSMESGVHTGLMIGVLLNEAAAKRLPFASDPAIPEEGIGLTCERCPIPDCAERAAPPRVLEARQQRREVREALRKLSE
jgi:XRE family transcriptional regulator, fatty acid utilization regulator